jgi:hypothetical protein
VATNKVLAFIRSGELRAVNLASREATRPRYAIDLDDVADFERRRQAVADTPQPRVRRKRQVEGKDYFA